MFDNLSHILQIPFYKGEHITFDVEPEKLPFTVAHADLELKVQSLSVEFDSVYYLDVFMFYIWL